MGKFCIKNDRSNTVTLNIISLSGNILHTLTLEKGIQKCLENSHTAGVLEFDKWKGLISLNSNIDIESNGVMAHGRYLPHVMMHVNNDSGNTTSDNNSGSSVTGSGSSVTESSSVTTTENGNSNMWIYILIAVICVVCIILYLKYRGNEVMI